MQKPKGTKDNFGYVQYLRQFVFDTLRDVSTLFNYKEIETPIFESQDVFVRAVGETSDIVSKEMYSFKDKGDRDIVLRPEGTAGVIRAVVENKLYAQALPLKLFYIGQMFRYENPQKGRQRQFTQFGVETFGEKSPYLDAEVILLASTILDALNIEYDLKINSLGDKETREAWSKALKEYFAQYKDQLTDDSINRLDNNPMRILDDKVDSKKDFVQNAPKLSDFYSEETQKYFEDLTSFLETIGVNFTIDHNLVRGLDYYTDTAFEFLSVSKDAGSQSTLIGGGRYENLVKQFGGPELSGIGFGLGIERIVNDLSASLKEEDINESPDVFVMNIDESATASALGVVYMLRRAGFATEWNYKPAKLQKAFTKADNMKATIKVIAGPKDLEQSSVMVKYSDRQESVKLDDLIDFITKALGETNENN